MTEIRSDDEDFQDLVEPSTEISESIRNQEVPVRRLMKVKIYEGENQSDAILLENQYYLLSVYQEEKCIKQKLKRRFSDFDTFFQILLRNYRGYILPAFPENGIFSFFKSKVSIAKDDNFLKERILMVQRFLTYLLNHPKFEEDKCEWMRKFLANSSFDLFKQQEKQKNQGLLTSSWNKIWSYVKSNKESRFKNQQEQLTKNKAQFEELLKKIKSIIELMDEENNWIIKLEEKKLDIHEIDEFIFQEKKNCSSQTENYERTKKILFDVYCQNEDFQMVVRLLRNLDDMRNDSELEHEFERASHTFKLQYQQFKLQKRQNLKKINLDFTQILKDISKVDENFGIYKKLQTNMISDQ